MIDFQHGGRGACRGCPCLEYRCAARLGFVGVGTIASAVVRGLCSDTLAAPPQPILLSPRGARHSAALATQLEAKVEVAPHNQAVVDGADVVFLGVLPTQVDAVLAGLTFDPGRHTLVSLVSTARRDRLVLASRLPAARVMRALPLPAVARQRGATALWPVEACPPGVSLFASLGEAVPARTEDELISLASATALMGQLFEQLDVAERWLCEQEVDSAAAGRYLCALYSGALADASDRVAVTFGGEPTTLEDPEDIRPFGTLVREQTPGGINEQVVRGLRGYGAFERLRQELDQVRSRLNSGGS